MLRPIDQWFFEKEEPTRSCLQFMRRYILGLDESVTENWRYGMPFYHYQGTRFCYLWVHKQFKCPYLGIVEGKKIDHPQLIAENRSRMKILLLHPEQEIPLQTVTLILHQSMELCK